MASAPGWWVYYRLIPSIVSTVMAIMMIAYIVLSQSSLRKERAYYSQLSLVYGVADIIQSVSWFIGPKYEMSYLTCSIQEHMFEFGSMIKAMTMVVISWSILYIIRRMKPFDLMDPEIGKYILALLVFAVFGTLMCIGFRTSQMFCNEDHEASIRNADTQQRSVYMLTYVIPIYIMYAFNIITTIVSIKYIMKLDTEITATSKLLQPLLPYPLIFTFALVPAGINLGFHMVMSKRSQVFENLAGLGISLCGVFYVTAFFYFQRVEWKNAKARARGGLFPVHQSMDTTTSNPVIMQEEAKIIRQMRMEHNSDSVLFTLPLESEAAASISSENCIFDRHTDF